MTIVVDASVLVDGLVDGGGRGTRARDRLGGERLVAPQLADLEVLDVLRRLSMSGAIDADTARRAVNTYLLLGVRHFGHRRLAPRAWELRGGLTIYDASYVALAELLGLVLVTADRRIASAPGVRCTVEVLT